MAYTIAHFCVDLACAFLLFRFFRAGFYVQSPLVFLMYSVIAFGFQAPFGALCDRFTRFPAGLLGCLLVALAFFTLPFGWFSIILCATGNAFFHVGGGIDSLANSDGKIVRSGIFVSTGAIGLALGGFLGSAESIPAYLPLVLLIVSAALIALFSLKTIPKDVGFGTASPVFVKAVPAALLILFVAIMIRSYGGFVMYAPWRTEYLLLPGISACIGKAAGGFIADRLGARTTASLSLLLCIPFLCFGFSSPVLCSIGIALFNMNMPVTLCAVSDRIPGQYGLAFGFTTVALLLGAIPAFFYAMPWQTGIYVLPALCAVSATMIFISISNKGGLYNERNFA